MSTLAGSGAGVYTVPALCKDLLWGSSLSASHPVGGTLVAWLEVSMPHPFSEWKAVSPGPVMVKAIRTGTTPVSLLFHAHPFLF